MTEVRSLCLDSTATLVSLAECQLWLQRLTHQGRLTIALFLPTVACPLASKKRSHRPRTFYPYTAFLYGTRPFSWKGTVEANCLSLANQSALAYKNKCTFYRKECQVNPRYKWVWLGKERHSSPWVNPGDSCRSMLNVFGFPSSIFTDTGR